jgi:hypothetical protein
MQIPNPVLSSGTGPGHSPGTGVARDAVSRAIMAWEKERLVECRTPDEKMDRYYRTTDTGKKVAGIIAGEGK